MAHAIVKLWPGKSEQQKTRLTDRIVDDVARVLGREESISVAIEDVEQEQVGRESLPDRDPRQLGEAVRETGIRDLTSK